MAASAVSALAVAGLPLFASPAHAAVISVEIVEQRDRANFDTDELRDGDDFIIETQDELGEREAGAVPDYRWVIDPTAAGDNVTGEWIPATAKARAGSYRVDGPSRSGGADGISDGEVQDGTWTLEARVTGLPDAPPVTVQAAESEITLDDGAASAPAEGDYTASGRLANAGGGLGGRAVTVNYTRDGASAAARTVTGTTDAGGRFTVTVDGPGTGQAGTLKAVASGEEQGDATQLTKDDPGPNDSENPDADAMDDLTLTWEGTAPPVRDGIVAKLTGRSNGARADRLRVVAPGSARGATVRLFRVRGNGRLAQLQVKELNRRGDQAFTSRDRNGRKATQYVAKVGGTDMTRPDRTNTRRLR